MKTIKVNYQLEMEKQMALLPKGEPILLHVCCAPCATTALQRLAGHLAPVVYYYNPNIMPLTEYEKRYDALRHLLKKMPLEHAAKLLESSYDLPLFLQAVKGLEQQPEGGSRCEVCFALRLENAAQTAAKLGIEWFTTSLTVGPRKNAQMVNEAGQRAAEKYGVRFLPCDFKKKEGYKQSIQLSAEYGLYRQHYCGCAFSLPKLESESAVE